VHHDAFRVIHEEITMPVTNTVQLTIAGVKVAVYGHADLSPKEQGEFGSALKRFTEVTGVDPHSTPADPAILRKLFKSGKWKQQGLNKRTWANIKSKVTRALELAGIDIHRTRANYALSPAWRDLLAKLPVLIARDVRRFGGWATALGLEPGSVTPEVFAAYLTYCTEQMTHRDPRERWHVARRAWNRVVEAKLVPAAVRIDAVELPAWNVRKWDVFPYSLKSDFDAFVASRNKKGLFVKAHKSPLSSTTVENYDRMLRTLATCLLDAGLPASALASLPALLMPENVEMGMEQYLRNDDPTSPPPRLDVLGIAIAAAVRWLDNTGRMAFEDVCRVRELCKAVKYRPTAMSSKNIERLNQFKDPKMVEAFLCLPQVVFDRLSTRKSVTVRDAQDAQMAALLDMLIHAPVRISNASKVSLTSHMNKIKAGGNSIWLLEWKDKEVKNKVDVRHQLSTSCSKLVDEYLERYRPILIKDARPELFLSQSGAVKGAGSLGKQLAHFIGRETGIVFNPHLIRHLMAYLYLKKNPGQYETVRRLLGHKSIQTTIAFYAGFEKEADQVHYDAMISSYRNGGGGQQPWIDRL
jgi:site-specific recombinase XerD